ncbi:MAG: HD domain-containing protein [Candidatus Latescibacteria bacterium]|nr:HD domain-containing protein [Candidatus Latescibacterota bacterium]
MKLIPVEKIQGDMVLGKSIYNMDNKLLLGAGFRITDDIKSKLIARGYNHVYIMEKGTEDIIPEDIISDAVKQQAQFKLANSAEHVKKMLKFTNLSRSRIYDQLQDGALKNINLTREVNKTVEEIIKDISAVGATTLDSILFKSKNSYHLDHAINTTVLSILIGKKYGFSKDELLHLALGAFLHDFGKLVTEQMKDSADKSTSDALLREHPVFGYLIMHNSRNASPMVCQIIKQHHESQDGSGYPLGLHGENLPPISPSPRKSKGTIYRLAEICTVADAYDKMVMNPLKEKQKTPEEAVAEIIKDAGTIYNKHIVSTLTTIIPFFPVGTTVKIKNLKDTSFIGYVGVIAKINEDNLNKPQILLIMDKSKRRLAPPRLIDTGRLSFIDLELLI